MHNDRSVKSTQGFSVIEVLISLVILGVGLSGVATLQKINTDGSLYAKQSTTADQLAQEKMAELGRTLNRIKEKGSEQVTNAATGVKFTRTWDADEDNDDGTTRINVTVTWPENSKGITVSTVGRNYVPDQAYRTLKVVPVAPTNKVAKAYTAESTSSCGRNTVAYCNDSERQDEDSVKSSEGGSGESGA